MVHEKNWRVSLCLQGQSSTRCPLNSCSHFGISEYNGSLRSNSWSSFSLVLDFWLAWSTGLPVLSFELVHLTQILGQNLSTQIFPARVSLSLGTVVVGEVDELEEDVG